MATDEESREISGGDPSALRQAQGSGRIDPLAMTVEQAAKVLGVGVETVRGHVAAGLPVGPGGTVNLVHYTAWLVRQIADVK